MTIFFRSHQITIRRARPRNNFQVYSATFTGYQADIQPVSADRINLAGGRLGKTYNAWIDADVDVKEGDQIVSGGVTYSVRSVSTFQGAGLLDHKELVIVAQD